MCLFYFFPVVQWAVCNRRTRAPLWPADNRPTVPVRPDDYKFNEERAVDLFLPSKIKTFHSIAPIIILYNTHTHIHPLTIFLSIKMSWRVPFLTQLVHHIFNHFIVLNFFVRLKTTTTVFIVLLLIYFNQNPLFKHAHTHDVIKPSCSCVPLFSVWIRTRTNTHSNDSFSNLRRFFHPLHLVFAFIDVTSNAQNGCQH